MPIYNGIEFIDESVGSVINQTYNNWELLIGVNGHPINSDVYQTACKFKDVRIKVFDYYDIKSKQDASNRMVKEANGSYIAVLDVDDIWYPTKLEEQIPYLNKYDVIGTKCIYFGEKTGCPKIPSGDISKFNFLKVNPIINSSSLIKKKYAWWDNTQILDDYDLWLRLWKDKMTFYNVDEILVKHRIHKASHFNNINDNHVLVLRKKYM